MRRALPVLFILSVVMAAVAGNEGAPPTPVVPAGTAPWQEEGTGLQYQGVSSCAAAACHNGNGPRGSRGSEYSTWLTHDPHSRAYAVLSEPRSRAMVENYRRLKTPQGARADKDPLCLGCHVQPGLADLQTGERFSAADGVGCEVCHGPAEKWLARHYRNDWRRLSPADKRALGWADTRDLGARAETCAGCHVGRGDADVNHALIASGHPRLRFEYANYLARYPRHWRLSDERRRNPDYEARAWEVGQLVSATAALELLQARATRPGAPWPEYAEYECAACHHDLQQPSQRQERGFVGRRPGEPPWGTWYYPLLPTVGRARGEPQTETLAGLGELHTLLERRAPDQTRAARAAERAAASLRRWRTAQESAEPDARRLEGLLSGLADADDLMLANWEGAAQLYLGLGAVARGLRDLDPACAERPGFATALQGLRRDLEGAFPEGRESVYDSPSQFDPAVLQQDLRRLRHYLKGVAPER
jgi:Cytochrome c554 and c-prime